MTEKDNLAGEYKRGHYPLEVRLYRETEDEKLGEHVATVEIEKGEKVTIHAKNEALAKCIDERLQKPVETMTGGEINGIFWDGFIELKPGDPGHAECVMYEFEDLVPRYDYPSDDARPD